MVVYVIIVIIFIYETHLSFSHTYVQPNMRFVFHRKADMQMVNCPFKNDYRQKSILNCLW